MDDEKPGANGIGRGDARVVVFGAGGHGRVVIDALAGRDGFAPILVVDDDPRLVGSEIAGLRVAGGRDALLRARARRGLGRVCPAIGDNACRAAVCAWLLERGFALQGVTHPAAVLAGDVEPGDGSVIVAGAVVNPGARLGRGVIVNTCASVDHDCVLGDFVHVAPGARLCGGVEVGAYTLVGAGAVILPGVRVGRGAVIGAGATVTRAVADKAIVVGTPARAVG